MGSAAFPAPFIPDTSGDLCWSEGDPFTGGPSAKFYWSATTFFEGARNAWLVDLRFGIVQPASKGAPLYVWPVRGRQ